MTINNEEKGSQNEDIIYSFDFTENGVREEELVPADPDTESIYGDIIEAKSFLPFIRWLFKPKYFATHEALKGDNKFIIEFIFILFAAFSYIFWPFQVITITEYFMFASWTAILSYLIALAYANVKTGLLPNKLLVGLFICSLFFVMTKTIYYDSFSVLNSSVIGFLAVGFIPYFIYVLTSGRFIGGGVVNTAGVVGFMLGAKYGMLSLIIVTSIAILYQCMMFFMLKKRHKIMIAQTGVFWLLVVVAMQLFGAKLI